MKIYFFTDRSLPNYLNDSDFYSYMSYDDIKDHKLRNKLFDFSCTGKYIHSNYQYWLCKNNNLDVELIQSTEHLPKNSIVFFHYDDRNNLSNIKNLILVQILSDKPILPNVNFYTSNSKKFVSSEKLKNCFYLPEPIPAKNLTSLPNESKCAKIFRFLGLRKNFPDFLSDKLINDLKSKDIFIKKEFSKNFVEQEDDIIFFLRKENDLLYNKHNNRVVLSYLNESPYIGTLTDDEKQFLIKKDDAINISYNKDSLLDSFFYFKNDYNFLKHKSRLKNNKDAFKHHWLNSMNSVISAISSQTQ